MYMVYDIKRCFWLEVSAWCVDRFEVDKKEGFERDFGYNNEYDGYCYYVVVNKGYDMYV